MLLDQGAAIEDRSGRFSNTPLMYAASNGQEAVVRFLLESPELLAKGVRLVERRER